MRYDYNRPRALDYINLRIETGMGKKEEERADTALSNSLFTISVYDDENCLIGFGRVVGDRGVTFVISDIMVSPRYQRQGYATRIMEEIDAYLNENTYKDSYVCLIANSPADKLYHKFGFQYLPDNKCGMLRKQ